MLKAGSVYYQPISSVDYDQSAMLKAPCMNNEGFR